jgi:hypothetical protein
MGSNVAFSVVKEFLPDLEQRLSKGHNKLTPGRQRAKSGDD